MNKTSLKIKTVLSLAMLIPMCSSLQAQVANGQLSAKWRASKEYNAHDNLGLVVVLKNEKNETVRLDKGDIFFNSMFPVIPSQNDKFSISDEKGNLFRIRFADGVELKAKDSIVLNYASRWPITNISVAPVGFYYQDRVDHSKFYDIPLAVSSIKSAPAEQNKFWAQLYDYNQVRTESNVSKLILPTPQSLVVGDGKLTLSARFLVGLMMLSMVKARASMILQPVSLKFVLFKEVLIHRLKLYMQQAIVKKAMD